jgi:hypothetical protein
VLAQLHEEANAEEKEVEEPEEENTVKNTTRNIRTLIEYILFWKGYVLQ